MLFFFLKSNFKKPLFNIPASKSSVRKDVDPKQCTLFTEKNRSLIINDKAKCYILRKLPAQQF